MVQVMAEKKTAEMKDICEDRPETKGVAKLVGVPIVAAVRMELPKAPAQAEAAKDKELPKAPSQVEADLLMKNKAEIDAWYGEVPWKPGFIEKGSSPKVTANSVWTVVTEVFDRKNRIPAEEWNAIQTASRFFGKMLCHGYNDRWAPERDGEQSVCLELAFNAAVMHRVFSDTCVPSDVYTCLKLQFKDKDRGRFHLCCATRVLRKSVTHGNEIYDQHGPPRRQDDAPHQNGARA